MNKYIRKALFYLASILALCLLAIHVLYFYVNAKYGIIYSSDLFFYGNQIIIILLLFGVFLLTVPSIMWRRWGSVTVAFMLALTFAVANYGSQQIQTTISTSPHKDHIFLIKKDVKTGKAIYYRTVFFFFAKQSDVLPYKLTAENIKVNWLTDNAAAGTYETEDGKKHQYVGTYGGDRLHNYGSLLPTIQGRFQKGKTSLDTAGNQITVNQGKAPFTDEALVPFGTIALVLTANEEAKWTLVVDEDSKDISDPQVTKFNKIVLLNVKTGKKQILNRIDK